MQALEAALDAEAERNTSPCSAQETAASPRPPPDLAAFWRALFGGRIVPVELLAEMTRPRSDWPEEDRRYGLGFHVHLTTEAVWLEGYDAGVSVCSTHDQASGITTP